VPLERRILNIDFQNAAHGHGGLTPLSRMLVAWLKDQIGAPIGAVDPLNVSAEMGSKSRLQAARISGTLRVTVLVLPSDKAEAVAAAPN
jgi:hypothetical protein